MMSRATVFNISRVGEGAVGLVFRIWVPLVKGVYSAGLDIVANINH